MNEGCGPKYNRKIGSGSSRTAHDRPEPLPAFSLKSHHLELLDRGEIVRACLDTCARNVNSNLKIEVGCLLHYILTGQRVTALTEDLLQALSHTVAKDSRRVVEITFGVPLRH